MPASANALAPATRNAREEVKSAIWLTIGVSTLSPVPKSPTPGAAAPVADRKGSAIIRVSVHIGPKNRIDPGLIAAFAAEPFEKVGVQSNRHGRLRARHDHACLLPKRLVSRLRIGVVGNRGMYLLVGHRAETFQKYRHIVAHEVPT